MAALTATDLGKCYRLFKRPFHRVLSKLSAGELCKPENLWAVRHVYLDVKTGSTVGIVGPNGAGKSTLLRLLVGITRPTEGTVQVEGRVTGILELGTGFHPEFSGYDNAMMNLAIQGFDRDTAESLMPEILAFSGLQEVIYRPLKTYSTGMGLRLAFAVATCAKPDVLVVDEALAVGDEAFRHRCMARMAELKQGGATIVLVSHDLVTVRHICSQVLLLDAGQPIALGTPEEVLDTYLTLIRERDSRLGMTAQTDMQTGARWGSGEVQIASVALQDEHGNSINVVDTGRPLNLQLTYLIERPIPDIVFGFGIYRSDGTYVHGSNHYWHPQGQRLRFDHPGLSGKVTCHIPSLPLLPGTYDISAYAYTGYDDVPRPVDHWERVIQLKVSERESGQHGLIQLSTEWLFD